MPSVFGFFCSCAPGLCVTISLPENSRLFPASRVYRPSIWTPEIFATKLWHSSQNINAGCDRKKKCEEGGSDRFHAINWLFSNWPLYKITKLSSSGVHWIIHLLLCLSVPFVQTFLSLLPPNFWMRMDGPGIYSRSLRWPAFQDSLLYPGLFTREGKKGVNGLGRRCYS